MFNIKNNILINVHECVIDDNLKKHLQVILTQC